MESSGCASAVCLSAFGFSLGLALRGRRLRRAVVLGPAAPRRAHEGLLGGSEGGSWRGALSNGRPFLRYLAEPDSLRIWLAFLQRGAPESVHYL